MAYLAFRVRGGQARERRDQARTSEASEGGGGGGSPSHGRELFDFDACDRIRFHAYLWYISLI